VVGRTSPLEDLVIVNTQFWAKKRVFITGHTGFKGSWLSLWLQELGAELCGYALSPDSNQSLYNLANITSGMRSVIGDIRNREHLSASIQGFQPDILFHMAAQPLVRYSYDNPIETYSTNVMGTVHVLEAARYCPSIRIVINVTTDKCYENKEWVWAYRENDPLGGYDPYSSSKACAELVASAYRQSFSQTIASVRAGNVIGGGDFAKDRLVPDIIRALMQNKNVLIRNPDAIRPWQHVLEPLRGYLLLAEKLWENSQFADGWNFGPYERDIQPVSIITDKICKLWGSGATWVKENQQQVHEAQNLKLDISKAESRLGWSPYLNLETTLEYLVNWYKAFIENQNMRNVTLLQIKNYVREGEL